MGVLRLVVSVFFFLLSLFLSLLVVFSSGSIWPGPFWMLRWLKTSRIVVFFFCFVAMALLLTPDDANQAMCDIAVDRAAKLGGT